MGRGLVIKGGFALMLCLAMVGCGASDQYSVIWVENQTDAVVDVFLVRVGESGGSIVIHDLNPGMEYGYSDIAEGCNDDLQLLAKDLTGTVISRSPTPLCRPSRWAIDQ